MHFELQVHLDGCEEVYPNYGKQCEQGVASREERQIEAWVVISYISAPIVCEGSH